MTDEEREALILLAYLFAQNGKYDKAAIVLRALDEVFPQDAYIPRLLAECLLRQRENREALRVAEKLLALAELSEPERRLAALLHTQALWELVRESPAEGTAWREAYDTSLALYLSLTEKTATGAAKGKEA